MQERAILWPNGRDRMGHSGPYADLSGDNIRAKKLADGSYELETSALSYTDARVLGGGVLKPVATKHSEKSPDFRGYLDEPDEGHGHQPARFEVTAWTKTIKTGDNAGQIALSLSLKRQPQ
jgi:hypothetical protein